MRVKRNPLPGEKVVLTNQSGARRVAGFFLALIGIMSLAGAVRNFIPGQGGHVAYGVICTLIGAPATFGGMYMLLLTTGLTIRPADRSLTEWAWFPGWKRVSDHDLTRFTAIEVNRYWYFDRASKLEKYFYCELRLWSAEGNQHDVIITRKLREDKAGHLAAELSTLLNLPIEWTKSGARGVVADD